MGVAPKNTAARRGRQTQREQNHGEEEHNVEGGEVCQEHDREDGQEENSQASRQENHGQEDHDQEDHRQEQMSRGVRPEGSTMIRGTMGKRLALLGLAVLVVLTAGRCGGADDKAEFARWEKDIAAFEKRDREAPPPKNGIVFVGSSSIRRWDLAKSFPGVAALNRGFGGSHLADAVHFAPRIVLKHEPRLVVLYAGDNDIAAGKTPERVAADFRAFIAAVHDKLPKTRIIYLAIKPSLLRWKLIDKIRPANALIEAECKKNDRLLYLDVATPMLGDDGKPRPDLFVADGLHLSAKGYELWVRLLKPHLEAPASKKE